MRALPLGLLPGLIACHISVNKGGDTAGDSGRWGAADADRDGVTVAEGDCDDADGATYPGADELCDGLDNDCDRAADEGLEEEVWYLDADGDGYGDPGVMVLGCAAPAGAVADDSDCDDADEDVNPAARERWYDGVDRDCDGWSDYDADGDGYDAEDYGGGDCDDKDDERFPGLRCRPVAGCVSPFLPILDDKGPVGATDLVFDDACGVWITSSDEGRSDVVHIDADGAALRLIGYEDFHQQSIALAPDGSGWIAVSHNDGVSAGIGYRKRSGDIRSGVFGTLSTGSLWDDASMNASQSSLAWDSDGCIWAPGFSGDGTLSCIRTDGTVTDVVIGAGHIESVALDSEEQVFVSVGSKIYKVNTETGRLRRVFEASDVVLDMVFDYNDDLYLEHAGGEVVRVYADRRTGIVVASVEGQGRLTISPDGRLVRLVPNPSGVARYEEWTLIEEWTQD